MKTDAQLIFASADDPDAFRCLYDRHAKRLHRFFARRTGDVDAAFDLTAETFAQAWSSRRRFRDLAGGNAGPWLFSIARRVLIASVAKRELETTMLDNLQVEWRTRAKVDLQPNGRWIDGIDAALEAELDLLPEDQRRAVELRVLRDLPYRAIARELGCTSGAARIRVSRGLARLRARMEATLG